MSGTALAQTNDAQLSFEAPLQKPPGKWSVPAWSAMPSDLRGLQSSGPFFLEIFSGTAGVTEAVQLMGVPVLPPIDIVVAGLVLEATDLLDLRVWEKVLQVLALGMVFFLHCGTPCNTFTAARKNDGGPPPLRSHASPMGLSALSAPDQVMVLLGNLFLSRTVEACFLVFAHGGDFSIENPLLSLMFVTPALEQLALSTRSFALDFDQCAFGAKSKKPTRLLSSSELLEDVQMLCPGGHSHDQLKGKVWDDALGRWVFKTKGAQVYPWALCATMASAITSIWHDNVGHFARTFALTTPSADRKRALGSSKPWLGHKQEASAQRAQWAGYQLKRGAAKPLLSLEMEPGQAVEAAVSLIHPFTVEVPLDAATERALHDLGQEASVTVRRREQLVQFWRARAIALLPRSVAAINAQPDPALRRLLLGEPGVDGPVLGQVCHIERWSILMWALLYPD